MNLWWSDNLQRNFLVVCLSQKYLSTFCSPLPKAALSCFADYRKSFKPVLVCQLKLVPFELLRREGVALVPGEVKHL